MKVDRLETHDRLLTLKKDQAINLNQGCEDCLKKNELSLALQRYSPYIYIFAHPRTCDDGVTKKMIWQPRLSRPLPQTNSYLFRAESNTDIVEICWLLPPREMWEQYKEGQVTESEITEWSIELFQNNRDKLSEKHPDDLSDEIQKYNLQRALSDLKTDKLMNNIYYPKQRSLEGYPIFG